MRSTPIALALVLWAAAAAAEAPSKLPSVDSWSHSGSGCPQSTDVKKTGHTFSDLGFSLEGFAVDGGSTANCGVRFGVDGVGPGWQLGLVAVNVTAWQQLQTDASIDFFLQAYWSQAASATKTKHITVTNSGRDSKGELQVPISFSDDVLWSPCSDGSGHLGLFNANLRASVGDGAYFGTAKGVRAVETFEWKWRKC